MLGAAVAFGVATYLLRKQLNEIGTLPDLNKKLRAREVQLAMMRTTSEQRRERIRQLLEELEHQSEETLTYRELESTAVELLCERDGRLPDAVRGELHGLVEEQSGRRVRTTFSSSDSIMRRLEMIQACREELEIAMDSSGLPYPKRPRETVGDTSASV
jgi:hypothetical protein